MRKKKRSFIVAFCGAITILSFYLLLTIYVNQRSVPFSTQLNDWCIGKMNIQHVKHKLYERLITLHTRPFVFEKNKQSAPLLCITSQAAGISYEADEFIRALDQLEQGHLLQRAYHRLTFPKKWSVATRCDLTKLRGKMNRMWEKEKFGSPVDAVSFITPDDVIHYKKEKTVPRIDWDALQKHFHKTFCNHEAVCLAQVNQTPVTITLPFRQAYPLVTLSYFKSLGIERKIIEFSTDMRKNKQGRRHNVQVGAKAIDGIMLKPNEVFDFAKSVHAAEHKYGFRAAPTIRKGRLIAGVGGGICQVSSTLYNAVLRTGLEVIERRNHSLPVYYLPKGTDAAFASNYINFRFKNTTEKHLLIVCGVKQNRLYVKFFGTFPQNVTYTVHSNVIKRLPIPIEYIYRKEVAVDSRKIVKRGVPGYVVQTFVTKKVDGVVQEVKKVSQDVYIPQPTFIVVSGENDHHGE